MNNKENHHHEIPSAYRRPRAVASVSDSTTQKTSSTPAKVGPQNSNNNNVRLVKNQLDRISLLTPVTTTTTTVAQQRMENVENPVARTLMDSMLMETADTTTASSSPPAILNQLNQETCTTRVVKPVPRALR